MTRRNELKYLDVPLTAYRSILQPAETATSVTDHTHALARLIREYQERTGDAYSDIARRAGLSKAMVGTWVTNPVLRIPRPENLVKLAKGLQVDVETVTRAAQEAAGYHVGEAETPDGTRILISHYTQLTPDEQNAVASLVEDLLRKHRSDGSSTSGQ